MIAVIFEAVPAAGEQGSYLEMAERMRPLLEEIEGFVSVERFQSLTNPDKLLSLSFFSDEAAVARWRNLSAHRGAQRLGRSKVFADYRLRVAAVVRDYGMSDRVEAPSDSIAVHT